MCSGLSFLPHCCTWFIELLFNSHICHKFLQTGVSRVYQLSILTLTAYHHHNHHHQYHQILSLLVQHRTSMKSFQALRSPAIPLTSFHDLLVLLISSSIVLHHVLFGLPLLVLYPWGFQSNAVFSIAPFSLRNVCPIQFHFLLFVWFSIDFWWVILHSSSFVILSVHFM